MLKVITLIIRFIKWGFRKTSEICNKTEVQVAVVAGIFAFASIFPSVYLANLNNNAEAALQRAEEVRKMKREFYNDLTEAFVAELMYDGADGTVEQTEARQNFLVEASKVPLYASEEMVEFIEKMKDQETAEKTQLKEYYIIMREDLCSDEFKEFEHIDSLSIVVPNDVFVLDENGKKTVFHKAAQ